MVIANRIFEDHVIYINCIFDWFVEYNIAIKGSKCFISYLLAIVLNQKVNVYGFSIIEDCFTILSKIAFPKNAQDLKRFLNITKHLEYYCKDYISVIKPLQKRKTQLLKGAFYKGRARFNFAVKSSFE